MKSSGYYIPEYLYGIITNPILVLLFVILFAAWGYIIRDEVEKEEQRPLPARIARMVFIEILPSLLFVLVGPYIAMLIGKSFTTFLASFASFFEQAGGGAVLETRGTAIASKISDRILFDVWDAMAVALRKSTGLLESRPNSQLPKKFSH
jgi:hypothetical protein